MRIILIVLCMVCALPSLAHVRSLTVVSWGGAFQVMQNRILFRPFVESTNINLTVSSWDGGLATLRGKGHQGSGEWDVVMVNAEELIQGCEAGLFETIDWAILGGRERYVDNAVNDCGVGAISYGFVLGYDGDRMKSGPKSWGDFWDVKKYPGKRALRRGAKVNLELALMADGVPPEEIYQLLSTAAGVDRAFKKLDQLKANLLWWESASQPAKMLASGEVVMASAYNSRLSSANRLEKKNLKWIWAHSLYTIDSWAIMKGSTHKVHAEQFIVYASNPAIQEQMTQENSYGATRKEVVKSTENARSTDFPGPENLKFSLYIDERFWIRHQDKLNQRFVAWVSR